VSKLLFFSHSFSLFKLSSKKKQKKTKRSRATLAKVEALSERCRTSQRCCEVQQAPTLPDVAATLRGPASSRAPGRRSNATRSSKLPRYRTSQQRYEVQQAPTLLDIAATLRGPAHCWPSQQRRKNAADCSAPQERCELQHCSGPPPPSSSSSTRPMFVPLPSNFRRIVLHPADVIVNVTDCIVADVIDFRPTSVRLSSVFRTTSIRLPPDVRPTFVRRPAYVTSDVIVLRPACITADVTSCVSPASLLTSRPTTGRPVPCCPFDLTSCLTPYYKPAFYTLWSCILWSCVL
jgi:hypothetical protein